MANPAPTADNAGILALEPSAACAAVGAASAAALSAAVGMDCATGRDVTGEGTKAAIRAVHASSTDAVGTAERGAAILWAAARKVLGVHAAMLKQLSHNGYKKASPQTLRLLRERSPCRAETASCDDDDAFSGRDGLLGRAPAGPPLMMMTMR